MYFNRVRNVNFKTPLDASSSYMQQPGLKGDFIYFLLGKIYWKLDHYIFA